MQPLDGAKHNTQQLLDEVFAASGSGATAWNSDGGDDEWNLNLETGEQTWVSNKGGSEVDYMNITLGNSTFTNTRRVQFTVIGLPGGEVAASLPKSSYSKSFGERRTVNYYKTSGAIDEMNFTSPFFSWGWAFKGIGALWGTAFKTEAAVSSKALGIAGEEAVGISGPKTGIKINGTTRFPDNLTRTTLEEVKNVKYQSFTRQLNDYYQYSQQNSLQMILHTRSTTTLSRPLQTMVDQGLITHQYIPGL